MHYSVCCNQARKRSGQTASCHYLTAIGDRGDRLATGSNGGGKTGRSRRRSLRPKIFPCKSAVEKCIILVSVASRSFAAAARVLEPARSSGCLVQGVPIC